MTRKHALQVLTVQVQNAIDSWDAQNWLSLLRMSLLSEQNQAGVSRAESLEEELFVAYQQNKKGLTRFIYGFVYNEPDTLDLLQDVFCIALDFLKRKSIETHDLRAWLYRIARNHCLNFREKGNVAKRYLKSASRTHRSSDSFEQKLLDDILAEKIIDFVEEKFTAKEQELFKLRYFYDLTLEEIKQVVDQPLSNISRVLRNCETKVREHFDDNLDNEKLSRLLVLC